MATKPHIPSGPRPNGRGPSRIWGLVAGAVVVLILVPLSARAEPRAFDVLIRTVLRDGEHTGALPGRALRGPGASTEPPPRATGRSSDREAIPLALAGEPGLALAGEPGAPRRPPEQR